MDMDMDMDAEAAVTWTQMQPRTVSVHGYVRTVKIMFTFMFTYRPKFYHADFKESLY
jgi:hypothetical protein